MQAQFLPAETHGEQPNKLQPVAPTHIIAIGVSTGGPNALQYLFSQLPVEFSGSILVVQHMPDGFTELFAKRLDDCCPIRVKEAQSGDLLVAGRALICPGNRHMKVKKLPLGNVAILSEEAPVNGHRPSVDVLFHSVAEEFGPQAMAVLMTGMGEDGAVGLGEIRAAGRIHGGAEPGDMRGFRHAQSGHRTRLRDARRRPPGSAQYFAGTVRSRARPGDIGAGRWQRRQAGDQCRK